MRISLIVVADMPNTLVANTNYVICAPVTFVNGEEKTFPSGGKVMITSTNKFANTITYSGTGTFMSGTTISEILMVDLNIIGNKSATLFNISGTGGSTFNLLLTDVRGWADVGTLSTMGIGIVFQSSIVIDNDAGIKLVNNGLFRIHRTAVLNFSDSGNPLMTVDALTNSIGLSTSTVIPQGTESAILINSSFVGEANISEISGVPAGLMFDAAGLDQTSIFVNAQSNQNLADSTTSADFTLTGNTAVTSIPLAGAMVEINTDVNWVGTTERMTLATDGVVTLDSLSPVRLKYSANINLEPSTATKSISIRTVSIESIVRVVTFTNGTNLINETATPRANGNNISFRDTAGTLPTEIRNDVVYFVISKLTNSFQISYTSGGSAITFSGDGTPTNSYKVATLHGATPTNTITKASPRDLIPQATIPAITDSKDFPVVINNDDTVDIEVKSGYQRYNK